MPKTPDNAIVGFVKGVIGSLDHRALIEKCLENDPRAAERARRLRERGVQGI